MSEFMRNMLNHTSDGTLEGDLGVIPKEWSSDPTMTQKWLYIVGDGKSPGDYKNLDGYFLCFEGSAQLGEEEDPEKAAIELKTVFKEEDPSVQVAIVTTIVDEDGDEIHSEVTTVV